MLKLGIDLGGTTVTAGLVDENLTLLGSLTWDTGAVASIDALETRIAALCDALLEKFWVPRTRIERAGIGVPGAVDPATGVVGMLSNLALTDWRAAEGLSARLGVPVRVDNDANAAAYGEVRCGAAKRARSAVCLTLGTGIGAGIVLDGKIYHGVNGAAGEIGHRSFVPDGRACACGRRGCWERYASSGALALDAADFCRTRPDSGLARYLRQTGGAQAVFDAAQAGVADAQLLLERYFGWLGAGVVDVIQIFQPEVLVLGGGVSRQGERLLAPLRAMADEQEYTRDARTRTKIVCAALGGGAGVLGAALL
ncbi:MAG: ROK family protein [Oscillospiraceae bacterium]|nr:ROK family protein [Oscillospiraceae bacterium]